MSTLAQPRLTPAEYLAGERAAETKSEFVNGQVYGMVGATRAHNLLTVNVAAALHARLRGRPCEVYASDMRVKVDPTGMYTYPDVVALCDEPRFEDEHVDTLLNPSVIIEVLSPSTEAYDRGQKFAHYRRLKSLREYVLLAQDRMRVEHFARSGEQWTLTEWNAPDHELSLASLGCALPLAALYERVELPEDPPLR